MTESSTGSFRVNTVGVFLDPPYAEETRHDSKMYAADSSDVSHQVREWAIEISKTRDWRIVLCGYEGEHNMPSNWRKVQSRSWCGVRTGSRSDKEVLWVSESCLNEDEFDWLR